MADQNGKTKKGVNVCGLIGMIFGILGVATVLCCCKGVGPVRIGVMVLGFLYGLTALILGIVGLTRRNKPKGMARAGLIMGIVVILLGIVMLIAGAIAGVLFAGGSAVLGVGVLDGIVSALSQLDAEGVDELIEVIEEFAELLEEVNGY